MNKPVIVSEETLTEPVVISDVTPAAKSAAGPAYVVLAGISFSHFLNDTMQSLIASVYPILKDTYALDFAQIGMITLAFQFTASLLQPVVGHYTDKKAQPYSLSIGMASTFFGLLLLSAAHQYLVILVAAALVGLGSAVFHPESARIARLASGGRYGFAQIGVPARRQFWHLDGTGIGRAHRRAVRAGQHRLVFLDRFPRDPHPLAHRPLVRTADQGEEDGRDRDPSRRAELASRHRCAPRAGRAAVLETALRLEPVELLHLLSDRPLWRVDPGGADVSLRFPRSERGRRFSRRSPGRSLRPQDRDLDLDPGRAAVHAGAALCGALCRARCSR
ncbi:hypothetical protein ACVWW2_007842 [Bradyrhizobium sp. LM4.3]